MFYQESETLLVKYPQYKDYISILDKFLGNLSFSEGSQLNIEVVSDIVSVPIHIVEFIFDEYVKLGLLKRKNFLKCPMQGDLVVGIEKKDNFPIKTFCDICGEEHSFNSEDVVVRYSLVGFKKMEGKKEINDTLKYIAQSGIPISNNEVENIRNSMPILMYLSSKINVSKKALLSGKRFIIVLHFLKDLIPFIETCENLGLSPSETLMFYKKYLYPHKDQLITYFKEKGYIVEPIESMDEALSVFQEKSIDSPKEIIVIEDGGYIVPKLHGDFKELLKLTIGAIEQTTKGIREDERVENLNFPVISVAQAELKNRYEPPHVARAVINNIQTLLSVNFSGKKALVIGYGAIGREIARQLRDTLKMIVTVYDINPNALLEAKNEGFITESILTNAVKGKFLIIGATGQTSIGRAELLNMEHNTYLVSASSDQREIGLIELESLAQDKEDIKVNDRKIGTKYIIRGTDKVVNLLADGFPINFWASNSMPNEVSDLIMSLIFVSLLYLTEHYRELDNKIDSDIVNQLANKYEIAKIYLEYQEDKK
jgi:adenosylhomocysteinase